MKASEDGKSQLGLLEEIAALLREVLTWTRALAYPSVKELLVAALDSPQKRLVYDALDGERSMAQVQELTGVNARFVSEWGQQWEMIGILQQSRSSWIKGRREKLFDLAMFGLGAETGEVLRRAD